MLSSTSQTASPFTPTSSRATDSKLSISIGEIVHDNTPYRILTNALPFPNEDLRFWWGVVAPTIQELMTKSNYSLAHQYQHLILIYQYIIPGLGPRPKPNGQPHWQSFMTDDFTPCEISVNFHDSKATVRFGFEPIGDLAGTERDPANQQASADFLHKLSKDASVGVNLGWYEHFAKELLVAPENMASVLAKFPSDEHRTQNMFAFGFQGDQAPMQAYIFPLLKSAETGISPSRLILDSILKLDRVEVPLAPALGLIEAYMAARPEIRAEATAFDCVDPRQSRIKLYLRAYHTSLRDVLDVYTLGGRLKDETTLAGIKNLRELWPLLLDVPAGYKDEDPLPNKSHRTAGFFYNFHIRPGKTYPETQVYIPVRHYGKSDLAVAQGLATYFRRHGWNELAESYPQDLQARFPSHNIDTELGTHTYISYSYKKGKGPYVTAYYCPKVYTRPAN
ncbi:aromatic prenyltransferase (DMATS family) [Aspergillus melleus]|uniref:Aromatic prenyltransferase (DMATS family) n=1 Tax=Aspergillus melleus TaxID=138277 RepID=A0ACC3AXV9_9EURO|nr:aromatic prenyltransferase (DMATS family) [Aspergillus melleus]